MTTQKACIENFEFVNKKSFNTVSFVQKDCNARKNFAFNYR